MMTPESPAPSFNPRYCNANERSRGCLDLYANIAAIHLAWRLVAKEV